MKIYWTDEALREIEAIVDYIADEDTAAAFEVADRIFTAVDTLLPKNPRLGRPGRISDTRELVIHQSYIVAYALDGDRAIILAIRHAARLWPEEF